VCGEERREREGGQGHVLHLPVKVAFGTLRLLLLLPVVPHLWRSSKGGEMGGRARPRQREGKEMVV
jgi:hypothetical protein